GVLAHVGAPHLRPREEEALLGREPVDELALLAGKRALERLVGEARAAEVGDVLAERELAVHFHSGQRLVAVELLDDFLRTRLELRGILRRPPVREVALRVVVAALVVEAGRDLVADDRADSAGAARGVEGEIEERAPE